MFDGRRRGRWRATEGGRGPTSARTVQGFHDIHYSAAFRMHRTGVQDWLIHTCPDVRVRVRVVHEDAGTALVRFTAFTL
ncbi:MULTISPECIES: hypothetical protein [unclassified Streptomyces]|uniref:hypothetical protein n=1 Tax=unclassified Streptomyces TaxID=2593676 RepID=UPI0035DE0480